MKFKIPFTFSPTEVLKKRSKEFIKFTGTKKSKLNRYLENAGEDINKRQYLAICYRTFSINFTIFFILSSLTLGILKAGNFLLLSLGITILIAGFIFVNQINYPKIFAGYKSKNIEKNLISVLQDMMVQLNSGVPIFQIMVNISHSNYGLASEEFKKIVGEINSGIPQINAIEKYARINTSEYFQRILRQISNGMRAGGDIGIVIKEAIKILTEEQTIQIQNYGSQLNPLIMFYMLIAVILPSLGITFLIIISSIIGASEGVVKLMFFSIFGGVVFMQMMFLGLIKSKRPSLL